jgi:3-dehydroquinate dehydratase-2
LTNVLILNGPNLNLLGAREPEIYGSTTLAEIEKMIVDRAIALKVKTTFRQSNHEGELVEIVQSAPGEFDGAIVNLGAYTHTSLAIRDAFLAAPLPFVEVHMSNLFRREEARHHSVVADQAVGMITGFGPLGYLLALEALLAKIASV